MMVIEVFGNTEWRCLALAEQLPNVEKLESIEQLFQEIDAFPEILKDNHRSLVRKGSLLGREVVAKQPRSKNRRLWPRVASWFEPAEARQTLMALGRMQELGIESVTPVLVLERRRVGMIVDSWVLYEYREGEPCSNDCLPDVIDFLSTLHQHGLRHNDPNFGNFLRDADGTLFTLDCKGRKRRGNFTDVYDFILLKRVNKKLVGFELNQVKILNPKSPGYWLAITYTQLKAVRSLVKDAIKRNRPKNTQDE